MHYFAWFDLTSRVNKNEDKEYYINRINGNHKTVLIQIRKMLVLPFLFLLTLLSIAAGKVQDNGQAREQCPYGWVEATYIDFGNRILNDL